MTNDEVLYILYIYTETLQKSPFYVGFKASLTQWRSGT